MFRHVYNALVTIALLAAALVVLAPGAAFAGDFADQLATWERLDHERAALNQRLEDLERDHQESVDTIEKLKRGVERGDISRSTLEDELRKNHRIISALERLQRQLATVDDRQAALRTDLLDTIDERRDGLEDQLREASTAERRAEIVDKINALQEQRRQFRAPLPEADQERLEQALADARAVSDAHPRAMLSAADELEDTREQIEARLEALDARIAELEQARLLARHSHQFGQFDRFFDESDRSRTIADYERTVDADANRSDDTVSEGGHDDPHDTDGESIDFSGEMEPSSDPGTNAPPEDHDSGPEPSPQETETIVIESQTDPEQAETTYFDDRALDRDLRRLQREREGLEDQARQLERKADQLRREAEEAY